MSAEAMKLALEALERLDGWLALRYGSGLTPQEKEVITALQEALAEQPAQQEPVAREHITDGNPCWCEPETNYKDPETGISVIVHKEPQ